MKHTFPTEIYIVTQLLFIALLYFYGSCKNNCFISKHPYTINDYNCIHETNFFAPPFKILVSQQLQKSLKVYLISLLYPPLNTFYIQMLPKSLQCIRHPYKKVITLFIIKP